MVSHTGFNGIPKINDANDSRPPLTATMGKNGHLREKFGKRQGFINFNQCIFFCKIKNLKINMIWLIICIIPKNKSMMDMHKKPLHIRLNGIEE